MKKYAPIIAAAIIAGAASFALTAFSSKSFGSPGNLLNLVQAEASAAPGGADPSFAAEAKHLAAQMCAECRKLAAAFGDENSTDDRILTQLNAVLARHDALERRIARHVLALRTELTPQQQQRLMGVFAQGIRRGMRCRGAGNCGGLRCRGRGCGRAKPADDSEYLGVLCHRLKFATDDLPADVVASAPLGKELQEAAVRLDDQRRALAALLENSAAEAEVLQQVDVVINAHDSLERLAASRILALRQQLAPQNRTRLMSLCARQVGSVSCPWRPDCTPYTCPLRGK